MVGQLDRRKERLRRSADWLNATPVDSQGRPLLEWDELLAADNQLPAEATPQQVAKELGRIIGKYYLCPGLCLHCHVKDLETANVIRGLLTDEENAWVDFVGIEDSNQTSPVAGAER